MKVLRTVLLVCALVTSFALPIFFLAVRHFHLESQTADWIVSMLPQSDVALEDKQALADMLVTFGELSPWGMLAYTAVAWCGMFAYRRFKRRSREESRSLPSGDLRSG